MDSPLSLKVSSRIVKEFIIQHLGFSKKNGYKNITVKKVDSFSFSIEATPMPYKATSIFTPSTNYKEYFNFVPYETTFCFENLDEGFDINQKRELDKTWQNFLEKKKQKKFKKLVDFLAYL